MFLQQKLYLFLSVDGFSSTLLGRLRKEEGRRRRKEDFFQILLINGRIEVAFGDYSTGRVLYPGARPVQRVTGVSLWRQLEEVSLG